MDISWLYVFIPMVFFIFTGLNFISDTGIVPKLPHPIKNARKRIEKEREQLYEPYKSQLPQLTGDYIKRVRPDGYPDSYKRNVALCAEWQKEWDWIEALPTAIETRLKIIDNDIRAKAESERRKLAQMNEHQRRVYIEMRAMDEMNRRHW